MALAIGGGITFGGGISILEEAGAPTDPFFSDVTLLLHGDGAYSGGEAGQQNNTFLDSSTNNYTLTRSGNTTQGTFSPFAVTAPYDPAVNGGSGYFDGTTDFLAVPAEAGQIGTSDVTFEAWVYLFDRANTNSIFAAVNSSSSSNPSIVFSVLITSGLLRFRCGTTSNNIQSENAVPLNQWVHVAAVRSSGALKLFINGELDPASYSSSASNITSTAFCDIGQTESSGGGGSYFKGYMGGFRTVTSALYSTTFTPPTSPFTAVAGTSLLCNFTNAGIYDNSGKNVLETVGNAQIDTTTKKFGTGSMKFDGTGDHLLFSITPAYAIGSSENFTVECWFYSTSAAVLVDLFGLNTNVPGYSAIQIQATTSRRITLNVSQTGSSWAINTTSTATFNLNEWNHLAVVRSGGNTVRVYLNGISIIGPTTNANALYSAGSYNIIGGRASSNYFVGFIDDFRYTKGVARYTEDFTPPDAPFPDS